MPFSSNPNTYKGLGVPLHGESLIQQESTKDVLTFEHTSANVGRFITFRDNLSSASANYDGSTIATNDLSWIGPDGAFRGPQFEVISPTTGADYTITSTMSGTLFNIGVNNGTSQALLLPQNPVPGFWFKVFVSTQDAAGDVRINTTANSSAVIHMPGMTSAVSSADCIEPASTLGTHAGLMYAVSSIVWVFEPNSMVNASVSTAALNGDDLTPGIWTTGTTA